MFVWFGLLRNGATKVDVRMRENCEEGTKKLFQVPGETSTKARMASFFYCTHLFERERYQTHSKIHRYQQDLYFIVIFLCEKLSRQGEVENEKAWFQKLLLPSPHAVMLKSFALHNCMKISFEFAFLVFLLRVLHIPTWEDFWVFALWMKPRESLHLVFFPNQILKALKK